MNPKKPHYHLVLAILSLLAVAGAYCAARFAFQWTPVTTDENSYLFQAYCFLEGLVSRPVPPFSEAFNYKMLIMTDQTGWLSRYAPGHGLYLVPGVLFDNPHALVALTAGVSLFVVAKSTQEVGDKTAGIAAGLMLLLSPFFIFHHGTLLSHTSGLLAAALMLWAYILWRTSNRNIFAVLAGLAWAFLFINRTYTAMLVAVPFAFDSLHQLWERRTRNALLGVICFAGTASTGLFALLGYNYLAIGDPLTMTYLFYNPTENLGFGMRYYGTVEHTWTRGVANMIANLQALNVWLLGVWGGLFLWLGLTIFGWTAVWSRLCCAVVLAVVLGYIFFWYPGPEEAGPGYYLEILPFMALTAALGLSRIAGHLPRRAIILSIALLVLVSGLGMITTGKKIHEMTEYRAKLLTILKKAPDQSLVFIAPSDHPDAFDRRGNDIIFNPQGLESRVLLARSLGPQDTILMRYFADRRPFRLTGGPRPGLSEQDPGVIYRIVLDGQHAHRRTGTNISLPNGQLLRVARELEHEPGLLAAGRRYHIAPGNYAVEFEIETHGCVAGKNIASIDVVTDGGREVLVSDVISVSSEIGSRVEALDMPIPNFLSIEPRMYYLGCGDIALHQIRISENP